MNVLNGNVVQITVIYTDKDNMAGQVKSYQSTLIYRKDRFCIRPLSSWSVKLLLKGLGVSIWPVSMRIT